MATVNIRQHGATTWLMTAISLIAVLVTSLIEAKAQGTTPISSRGQSIVFPAGGEVFAAGDDVSAIWDPRSFHEASLLRLDVWEIGSGCWVTLLRGIPNNGRAKVVFGPMVFARIRLTSMETNEHSVSQGYFTVNASTRDSKIQSPVITKAAIIAEYSSMRDVGRILETYALDMATLDIYSYDGRLLHKSARFDQIGLSMDANELVLLHVNLVAQPPQVTLVLQR